MPLPEDIERVSQTSEDMTSITSALEETSCNTDALMMSIQNTEQLEVLPPLSDHRSASPGSQHQVSPQSAKETSLPDTSVARSPRRLLTHLREENRRLRHELNTRRTELQQLVTSYNELQTEFEQETTVIHTGHQRDVEHYQTHLQAIMEERNRLQEACTRLEQNYQDLYQTFQNVVEEEIQKRVTEASFALQTTPDTVPPLLQDLVHTLQVRSRTVEEKHLIEALFLKSEVQTLAQQLQQERKQLNTERQKLMALQQTAREQAELRQRTLKARLHARWKVSALMTTVGLLALLVILQFVFLFILHVSLIAPVSFSIFAPIVLCTLVAWLFTHPTTMLKHIYTSAPHKKRIKKHNP